MGEGPRIVVLHHDLNKRGGGEAVCLTVCEALEEEFNVTLLLTTPPDDMAELNEYFNTDVSETRIEVATVHGVPLGRLIAAVEAAGVGWADYFVPSARNALYNRYMPKAAPDCDMLVSTWNEVAHDEVGLHYVHYPDRCNLTKRSSTDNPLLKRLADVVDEALFRVSNYDPAKVEADTLLVNSAWTEQAVRDHYDTDPVVVHPPVDTEQFADPPEWDEREDGFVFLSRVSKEKNVLWLIDILSEVRERGHDVHFHVVGPPDTEFPEYYERVEKRAAATEFVSLEGELWGDELMRMLQTHRYGINGAKREQFGIAIAEMIAAGMLPFVPDSGGQTVLVNGDESLTFGDTDDAVETICRVLSDPDRATSLCQGLPDVESRYGVERFKDQIVDLARERMAGQ
jgi:glycosyltransferase involved in cell wall biosynthesis